MLYDVVIIGGGVIGALTARELSRYRLKICLLEKETDIATGASAANSGIVHAGHDAAVGSLKAKYNIEGSLAMPALCADLGVKYRNNGTLVVGDGEKDLESLKTLLKRGETNGVKNLKILSRAELIKKEPNISDGALYALEAPAGSIVCPYGLNIAAMGNAMDNGAELICGFDVVKINKDKDSFCIISESGQKVEAKIIINCAGINSDKIASLIGDKSFKMGARKGEYILLSKENRSFVTSTLFACPNEKGKGVLVTSTVDGNILLGPTSVETDDKSDSSIARDGFSFIIQNAARLAKNIPLNTVISSFCGVRAYSDRHDFIIEKSEKSDRFINVAGIESPGLTASPAIAKAAAALALSVFGDAKVNTEFNPYRKSESFFETLSLKEKNTLIKKEPAYGKIVCRCEQVTLGEVLYALSVNPPPKTIDAIKRRTRSGMGRCQGGFCQPSIAEAIKKHFNMPLEEIKKNRGNSYIFTGKTK